MSFRICLFFFNQNIIFSDIIYSEPYHHYRNRAEPQVPADHRRRGDEILQIHHGIATSLGNGHLRLQPNMNAVNRRDGGSSIIAFDPHLSHLITSGAILDRRESSASGTSSVGSFDSGSTLTSDLGENAIMTRLRKSFERKEEFLRGTPSANNGDIIGQF